MLLGGFGKLGATRRKGVSAPPEPVVESAPANVGAPVASGGPAVGSTLSATLGSWTGYPPPSYARQWRVDGADVGGATAETFDTTGRSVGASVTCRVTATNSQGSAQATSNAIVLTAVPVAPSNSVAPAVTGSDAIGATLSVSNGTWSGEPAPTFARQWRVNGVDVGGATGATFDTTGRVAGQLVTCLVTATNAAGSVSALSNAVALVDAPVVEARALSESVGLVGHSLVNMEMPLMIDRMIRRNGGAGLVRNQVIIGSPLSNNWTNHLTAQGWSVRDLLGAGALDAVVLAEAGPIANYFSGMDYQGDFDLWYDHAKANNPDCRVFLYEIWPGFDRVPVQADWRATIHAERVYFQTIAAASGADVRIVPGGRAMANLYDAIEAGSVPGLTDIADLFDDAIHLTNVGNYFIACVQYATVYGRTPVGHDRLLFDDFFPYAVAPASDAQALALQQIAHDTVEADPDSGVTSLGPIRDTPAGVSPTSGVARFDGTAYLDALHSLPAATRRITIAGRVTPRNSGASRRLFFGDGFDVELEDAGGFFGFRTGAADIGLAQAPPSWMEALPEGVPLSFMVTVDKDGGLSGGATRRVWVNGVERETNTATGSTAMNPAGAAMFGGAFADELPADVPGWIWIAGAALDPTTHWDDFFAPDGTCLALAPGGLVGGVYPDLWLGGPASQWMTGLDLNGVRYAVIGTVTEAP